MRSISVGGHLAIETALEGAKGPHPLRLSKASEKGVKAAARTIHDAVTGGERVYGVTTGFGSNAERRIAPEDARPLQENLLRSHAFGDGPPFDDEVVRLALLLRIHALS